MVSYGTADLNFISKNRNMLQTILRDTFGLTSLIMSYAFSIGNMYTKSKTALSLTDSAVQALKARIQMYLAPGLPLAFPTLMTMRMIRTYIVTGMRRERFPDMKFATGVFDEKLPDPAKLNQTMRTLKHLELNRNNVEGVDRDAHEE